jgi:hypothetical protein
MDEALNDLRVVINCMEDVRDECFEFFRMAIKGKDGRRNVLVDLQPAFSCCVTLMYEDIVSRLEKENPLARYEIVSKMDDRSKMTAEFVRFLRWKRLLLASLSFVEILQYIYTRKNNDSPFMYPREQRQRFENTIDRMTSFWQRFALNQIQLDDEFEARITSDETIPRLSHLSLSYLYMRLKKVDQAAVHSYVQISWKSDLHRVACASGYSQGYSRLRQIVLEILHHAEGAGVIANVMREPLTVDILNSFNLVGHVPVRFIDTSPLSTAVWCEWMLRMVPDEVLNADLLGDVRRKIDGIEDSDLRSKLGRLCAVLMELVGRRDRRCQERAACKTTQRTHRKGVDLTEALVCSLTDSFKECPVCFKELSTDNVRLLDCCVAGPLGPFHPLCIDCSANIRDCPLCRGPEAKPLTIQDFLGRFKTA